VKDKVPSLGVGARRSTQPLEVSMHAALTLRRPGRLWAAAILNILIGLLAVGFLAFLFTSERVPDGAKPGLGIAASAVVLASLLVVYSVLALVGRSSARPALLIVATLYFGSIILQNALPLLGLSESIVPARKLTANVIRNSISLGVNWWALTSSVTIAFLASKVLPSNISLERTRGG
jgi:hypothetical protein